MYAVKFAVLNSNQIINLCGPYDFNFHTKYCAQRNTGQIKIQRWEAHSKFYSKLENSILSVGYRNPILVDAGNARKQFMGRVPHTIKENIHNLMLCTHLGGSRLWVGQKHNLNIPCLIIDYVEMFIDYEPLTTVKEIRSYFSDQPKTIRFVDWGLAISPPQKR